MQAAVEAALSSFSSNGALLAVPYDSAVVDSQTDILISLLSRSGTPFGLGSSFWQFRNELIPLLRSLVSSSSASTNDIADIAYSLLHLENVVDSDSLVLQSLAAYVSPMQFRSDLHGWELLVGAPDLERLLSVLAVASTNLKSSVDGIDYRLDQGIPVYGSGSQGALQVEGLVDIGNWPDYFTGEYDYAMLEELRSATELESDWDDVVGDIDDVAYDAADDADSEEYEGDVTNSVETVYFSTDEVEGFLPVRDQVFDPVLGLIPRERAFSSDVLILPEISAYGIPRMEYSFGSHPEIESALVRAGQIFGHVWDVFFGVFVCWLIWREYNFYFHTMR